VPPSVWHPRNGPAPLRLSPDEHRLTMRNRGSAILQEHRRRA
jgi:hypothetical protein